MRVCLISREYPPETGYGGIATFSQHLALGLSEIGHDVEVVSLAEKESYSREQDGILLHRVKPYEPRNDMSAMSLCMPYSRYLLKTSTALWRKFFERHQVKPFDVVDTPELLAEGLYNGVTKVVPMVTRLYTPHSKFLAEKLHSVKPSFDHLFVAMMERVAMRAADCLTSPSNDLADFVAGDMAYPRGDIRLIHNPIDPIAFSPEGEKAIAPDPSGKKLVLFVGRLEERKGVRYLVEAIPAVKKRFPQVKFLIIGGDTVNAEGGQTSVLAQLKSSLAKDGCTDDVQFISRVPLQDLPKYYRSADICIVPSVYDNSPYTCLEAMSCGRAVIGTSGGGTPEYLPNEEAGVIIPPRDVKAIEDSLVRLLSNDGDREKFERNARQRVLEKFQRKEIARQTTELYELAAQRHAVAPKPYLKPAQDVLGDAALLIGAFDEMLYNLLYQESVAFRVKHWARLGKKRPGLFTAKAALAASKGILRTIPVNKKNPPKLIQDLENKIQNRQALDAEIETGLAESKK